MRTIVAAASLTLLMTGLALAAEPPPALGGGYKDAKWGMDPNDVRSKLTGKAGEVQSAPDGDTSMEFELAEGRRLTCWFYKDKLYLAVLDPGLKDGDAVGAEALLMALQKKYGTSKLIRGTVNGEGKPLVLYSWSDDDTEIRYQMLDPKGTGNPKVPSASVKATYRSKALAALRDQELAKAPKPDQRKEAEAKAASYEGDI